jgi:CO dehydrogenase/acetyl-CoA synthase beta subunit
MLEPKTHFEQVPIEIVRKMVEEQIRRETATEQDEGTMRRTLEDLFGVQEQPMVRSRAFSQAEV